MQIVYRGQNNTLVFTLAEKQTLTNPYFLFSLSNQVERSPIRFIVADTSSYSNRYNKFLITETSESQNLTSGVVTLSEPGDYEYEIYEQSSSSNLNPALCDNLVPLETGIIRVVRRVADRPVYNEYDDQSKTVNTYNG